MNLGAWLQDLGVTDTLFFVLRVVAGVGAAFLGWVLSDPITRVSYRLAAGRPVPGWALPWFKLASAGVVGALIYLFLPLGTGSGGLGFGPGRGGTPGAGAGDGTREQAKTPGQPGRTQDPPKPKKADVPPKRDVVEIEIIPVGNYQRDQRYYLLERRKPARTLDEIEAYLKQEQDRIEVHVLTTSESVGGAVSSKLMELAQGFRIPLVEIYLEDRKESKN